MNVKGKDKVCVVTNDKFERTISVVMMENSDIALSFDTDIVLVINRKYNSSLTYSGYEVGDKICIEYIGDSDMLLIILDTTLSNYRVIYNSEYDFTDMSGELEKLYNVEEFDMVINTNIGVTLLMNRDEFIESNSLHLIRRPTKSGILVSDAFVSKDIVAVGAKIITRDDVLQGIRKLIEWKRWYVFEYKGKVYFWLFYGSQRYSAWRVVYDRDSGMFFSSKNDTYFLENSYAANVSLLLNDDNLIKPRKLI